MKKVSLSAGEIEGLDPCTKYELEVTAVYNNNESSPPETKTFQTSCKAGIYCDPEAWQESLEIVQDVREGILKGLSTSRFFYQSCLSR